ncbi:MAG: sensor histidine kinase [Chloroflexi bacterium]|nr:sensor histidine kinase [Chloroflexota bacterium]
MEHRDRVGSLAGSLVVGGAILVVVALHYFVASDELLGLFTSLAFLPTAYGALAFGLKGGLGAAVVTGAALVPHFVLHHRGPEQVTEIGEIVVIVVSGALIGWQVDRVRHQRERERLARQRLERYARGVTAAQEEERRRIARDLHDDTIQGLVSVSRRLEALEGQAAPPVAGEVREVRQRTQALLDGVRRFSRHLRPPVVDDLGLVPAIEGLASQQRVPAEVRVVGSPRRLPSEVEVALFRIAQEALSNVEKHSGASRATVRVAFNGTSVSLAVSDDGCGFSAPQHVGGLAGDGRLGLLGMQERAELIGGAFRISSTPGQGTTVTVEVPM